MSEQMKKLLAVVLIIVVAVVGLDAFGKLPGGIEIPGVHARFGGAAPADDGSLNAAQPDCPPTDGSGAVDPNAAVPADPNAVPADPNAVPADPNAVPADPNAVPADPNAVPADPNAVPADPNAVPADPTMGVAYMSDNPGVSRIVAAGAEPRYATDTPIFAAEGAVDPATGEPIADQVATEPATGEVTMVDPCAPGVGDDGSDAAGAIDPATGAPVTPSTPAPKANPRATTDDTSTGNSPEALRMAQEVQKYLSGVQIQTRVAATLLPAAGGEAAAAKVKPYRAKVTAAVLVVSLADPDSDQNWKTASKATKSKLIVGFLTRLKSKYPASARSVSLVDSSGVLLAVGDAPPTAVGTAKILG